MKLIKYISIGLISISLFGSCTDFLDKEPDPELDINMVFENRTKVEGWLAGVYSGIPNPSIDWLNYHGWEIFADDITPSKDWQQWEWKNIPKIFGEWTPNTEWAGGYWHRMPQLIRQANIFLERVHALPESGLTQKEVDYMKAECRFLSAYFYWLLTSTYGPIPFQPGYIAPTDFVLEDLMIGQTPFDEIVDYLDKEMLEASKQLPATHQDINKYGRVTSIMCLTVRAKMLLFAASPLVNGNDWYKDHLNDKNEELFNTTYDQQKWIRAAEACKLLLDEAEMAGHKLYVELGDDDKIDPFLSLENLWWTGYYEGNKEILFPYTKKDNYANYEFYTNKVVTPDFSGGGGLGVYQGLVDAFFTANGLPIDEDSEYTESGFSSKADVRNTKWTGGAGVSNPGVVTTAGTYNMYCNREPRFYTAVSYNGSWYSLANRKFNFFKGGPDNKGNHDAPQNGYLVRKKIYPDDNPKDGKWKFRQPFLYRLSASYLDYSEAVNEAYNTRDARLNALKYLNMVRERAGVRKYTLDAVSPSDKEYIHVDDSQDAVRNIVRMERRVELCVEGSRWDDIRRWRIAEQLPEVTGACYGMNKTGDNNNEFYQRTVFQTRVWKKQYYWFPIFITTIENNPNLRQSPFWK